MKINIAKYTKLVLQDRQRLSSKPWVMVIIKKTLKKVTKGGRPLFENEECRLKLHNSGHLKGIVNVKRNKRKLGYLGDIVSTHRTEIARLLGVEPLLNAMLVKPEIYWMSVMYNDLQCVYTYVSILK